MKNLLLITVYMFLSIFLNSCTSEDLVETPRNNNLIDNIPKTINAEDIVSNPIDKTRG